jgi:hypothetical protein
MMLMLIVMMLLLLMMMMMCFYPREMLIDHVRLFRCSSLIIAR